MIRWHRRDADVYVSENLKAWFKNAGRGHVVLFRVDGRNKAREGYRVDRGGVMGWEAIDRGEGFRTLKEAKAHADRYFNAIEAQETLTPHMSSRDRVRRHTTRIPIARRARRDEDVAAIEATFRRLSNVTKDYLHAYTSSCSRREVEDLYARVPERERATVRRLIDGDRPAWRDCPRGWEDA